jgi:hypothetical protein
MILTEEVDVRTHTVVGFQCDKCKREFRQDNQDHWIEMQEYIYIDGHGGFGSVWGDGSMWSVTLCQDCAHAMFKDIIVIHDQGIEGEQP